MHQLRIALGREGAHFLWDLMSVQRRDFIWLFVFNRHLGEDVAVVNAVFTGKDGFVKNHAGVLLRSPPVVAEIRRIAYSPRLTLRAAYKERYALLTLRW